MEGMYNDVVKSCEECQRRSRVQQEEPWNSTWSIIVWEKVEIDVIYMPWTAKEGEFGFIVFARDHLSGWIIKAASSKNVAKFSYKDVICIYECPRRIALDYGRENLDLTKEHHKIKRTVVSAYHRHASILIEGGHDSIVNSLSKYCSKES